jgi:phage recombination protein Bet
MAEIVRTERRVVMTPERMDLLKKTIAPQNATTEELELFALLCEKYNLDPFAREIIMQKFDTKYGQRISFITTRDGYLKIAMQDENFDGIISFVVREGDEFEIDASKLEVKHKFGSKRGAIIGAWAMARHKTRPPVIVFVDFKEYYQDTPVWKQYPSAMIQKVAEVSALRRQFNVSGLVAQEEMGVNHYEKVEAENITDDIPESVESIEPANVSENQVKEDEPKQEQTKEEKMEYQTALHQVNKPASKSQIGLIMKLMNDFCSLTGENPNLLKQKIKHNYSVEHISNLTVSQASNLIENLQAMIKNAKEADKNVNADTSK